MLSVAVVPDTVALPADAPSSVKVTVPVGVMLPWELALMVATNCMGLPAVGEEDVLTPRVVAFLATVRVAVGEFEPA